MKRCLIVFSILSLILTSCGKTVNNTVQVEDNTTSSAELIAANEVDKHYSADGVELRIDMSQYGENAKLLTADDIYLLSYNCGYIAGTHPELLIIEDQEQLDYALERYGLALPPDGLTMEELWFYDTSIAEPFNKMMAEYPIRDYSYVIEYDKVGSGGYDLKVGALLVDEEQLFFVHTSDSRTPEPGSLLTDVLGGFCYMAAIPKDTLMNRNYRYWTYPSRDDVYQDADFSFNVRFNLADTTELYQVYGDMGYIVRSNEELQALVNMAQNVTNQSNQPVFSFKMNVDFEKNAILFKFFTCDGDFKSYLKNGVLIENDTIQMQYDITAGNHTGFAYAIIPVRFLPNDGISGWKTPVYEAENVYAPQIPEIDMSKYSKNAKFFTADEITLYGNSINSLGFDGKYSLFCMEDNKQKYVAWIDYGFGADKGFLKLVEHDLPKENVIFIQYIPQTEENSDLRLLGIIVDNDKAEFVYYDRNSERKYNTGNGTGGFGFYAAVPIGEVGTGSYEGWEIPKTGN